MSNQESKNLKELKDQTKSKRKCEVFESRGYCTNKVCSLLHDMTDKTICSECGRNSHNGITHWKPLPECFHLIFTQVATSNRKGGLTPNGMAFRCCGCENLSGSVLNCSVHRCGDCECRRKGRPLEDITYVKGPMKSTKQDVNLAEKLESLDVDKKTDVIDEALVVREVCRLFNFGDCRFGDKCKYLHQISHHENGGSSEQNTKKNRFSKMDVAVCRSFQLYGLCGSGDKCRFLHVAEGGTAIPDSKLSIENETPKTSSIPDDGEKRDSEKKNDQERQGQSSCASKAEKSKASTKDLAHKLCKGYGMGTCKYGNECRKKHGSFEEYDSKFLTGIYPIFRIEILFSYVYIAVLCPFESNGDDCRIRYNRCRYRHEKAKICKAFQNNGYCLNDSCPKVHDMTGKGLCPECGWSTINGVSHWKPTPECFHIRDSAVPSEKRKGGLTADHKAFKCCGCTDIDRDGNRSCAFHNGGSCSCPLCRECGQRDHTSPRPECYHTGWWDRERIGGWTPAMDGMVADWHCCGCDDHRNNNCDNHNIHKSCSCYVGRR
jgi:hypothetical protein